MNILLFNASNSEQSIHRVLLDAVHAHLGGHDVTYSSAADFDLPFFSIDLEREEGYPEEVQAFYDLIAAHDAVILACPEHNRSTPAAFKNLFDWTSRYASIKGKRVFFPGKKVLLFSTSPGPNGGATNLAYLAGLLPWQGAKVVGQHSLGGFGERFTEDKPNAETDATIKEAIQALFA